MLGICNGFQILCEAHLLPGALMRNAGLTFVSKPVDVDRRADRHRRSPRRTQPARRLRLPVAHGDGRFVAADDTLRMLEAEGRVVLRYVAATEGSPFQPNPNGSANHIAGICNAAGQRRRHHAPSRACRRSARSACTDGLGFFTSMAALAAAVPPARGLPSDEVPTSPAATRTNTSPSRTPSCCGASASAPRRPRAEAERKSHYMKCPKDGYDLASSAYHGVQIETCPHCGGMWLDAGELDAVAHEDRPGLLTRVLSERASQAFRARRTRPGAGK